MSRKIGKKRQQDFIKAVIEIMTELKAEVIKPEIDSWIAQWTIITRIGILQVTLPKEHDHLFTIFCRFENTELYSKFDCMRVNKFSGKWNFHAVSEGDCLNQFELELHKIVIDQYKTDVVFRKWRGDIIALMPHEVNDHSGHVLSYMHVGQHGDADYSGIVKNSKLATYEEYKDLLNELETCFGYNLNVVKRQVYSKFIEDYNRVTRGV